MNVHAKRNSRANHGAGFRVVWRLRPGKRGRHKKSVSSNVILRLVEAMQDAGSLG